MATVRNAVPILPVRDIPASVAFFRDRLGFPPRHTEETFAIVRRDETDIMLTQLADENWRTRADFLERPVCSGAESFISGTAVCRVHVHGIDELYAEYLAAGVVRSDDPISNQWWGDRDFSITDVDGNLITFFEPTD